MVGITLEQQLRNLLRSLHDQGILDLNFENVRRARARWDSQCLIEAVTALIDDLDVSMAETAGLMNLDEPELDYETLDCYIHQLQERSASIGGCRMVVACRNSQQAIDAKDKARCVETFEQVKQEYQTLRDALNNFLQLERYIMAYENRRNGAQGSA
ncbi:histidine-containing phosphotransfer protein 4-like [Mangifera indica]|uniref:histidine-containing phosphotransfer protein 4-like n=1 Tax=Mangifera indica TaxID=29780 RepID=UPI001CFB80EF|nr:histidine-containing phosphotransfer protein 4-like [Mangifera indica]